jgi:hypothetical protein
MTDKYVLTDETITLPNGKTARRIKALVDIGEHVKAGDLGGYIENEDKGLRINNLSNYFSTV